MTADPLPRLGGPEYFADPFPHLEELALRAPVAWSPELGRWVVTGRDAVLAVLRDPVRFSSAVVPRIPDADRLPGLARFTGLSERWLFFRDPPEHGSGRLAMQRAFTPRAMEALRPVIRERAETLLDAANGSSLDVVTELAHPLAAGTVAGFLCACPEDRAAFLGQCAHLAAGSESPREPRVRERGFAAISWLAEYVERLCEPDTKRPAFVEELLAQIGPEETAAQALVLVFAGIETTQNLIGNSVLELLRRGVWADLAREPQHVEAAVEECLRTSPPVLGVVRRAVEAVVLEGRAVERGQELLVMTAAADRTQPERLGWKRTRCPHLAFGHGIHYCVGAALARMEAAEALRALLHRYPGLRPSGEPLEWLDHDPIVRGLKHLRVPG